MPVNHNVLIVSFYTPGYEQDAEMFRETLEMHGMRHHIEKLPSYGDWYDNTRRKPEFIEAMLIGHRRGGVMWIDCDAFIHRPFNDYLATMKRNPVDFACHWFKKLRMLSGTLYFGNTAKAVELLRAWQTENKRRLDDGDREGGGQKNLWRVYDRGVVSDLNEVKLPGRFCWIAYKEWAYLPEDNLNPVIEHTIASRHNRGDVRYPRIMAEREKRVLYLKRLLENKKLVIRQNA